MKHETQCPECKNFVEITNENTVHRLRDIVTCDKCGNVITIYAERIIYDVNDIVTLRK